MKWISRALVGTILCAAATAGAQQDFAGTDATLGIATIRMIQGKLNLLGYDAGRVDGMAGPETKRAIRQYQADNGLQVTGDITPGLIRSVQTDALGADAVKGQIKSHTVWRARDLLGKPVRNRGGHEVGEVADLLMGREQTISSLVISLGGPFDFDRLLIAVPWRMGADDIRSTAVDLPVDDDDLRTLRGEIERFYNPDVGQWLASSLIGAEARIMPNWGFGAVDGLKFDAGGRLQQLLVRSETDGRVYPVSPRLARLDPAQRYVDLETNPAEVAEAPVDR